MEGGIRRGIRERETIGRETIERKTIERKIPGENWYYRIEASLVILHSSSLDSHFGHFYILSTFRFLFFRLLL